MKTLTLLEKELQGYEGRTCKSRAAWERAKKVMPMGTASNSRMYAPYPLFIARTNGSRVWDVDGNEYLDHNLSFGALVAGHRHPLVMEAVSRQLEIGTMYGISHELEAELAAEVCKRYPFVDRVRFSNSGTECTLHAIRLAKAYTGKPKIVKMEGSYHGLHDAVMVSVKPTAEDWGGALLPAPVAASAGVSVNPTDTLVAQFNDIESLKAVLSKFASEVAAVIMEPVMMNVGVLLPKEGYLQAVMELCRQYGVLLIFDEVKTSSMSYGGASETFGIAPDIICLSKSIGGGFPLAAFASSSEIMEVIESRKMMHAGTYNANPVVIAAGLATLKDVLTPTSYIDMRRKSDTLADGYREILADAGVTGIVTNAGVNGAVTFGVDRVSNYREWSKMNAEIWQCFWFGMVNRGVIAQPYWWDEQWTISVAHTDEQIDRHLEAFREVAKGLRDL
ncbi:MAG TPA: aspartate aminotransferase family protein [Terriglobales bacterium]|nr:aspartate aminotransferase family protein [Terriglobales bacterium]